MLFGVPNSAASYPPQFVFSGIHIFQSQKYLISFPSHVNYHALAKLRSTKPSLFKAFNMPITRRGDITEICLQFVNIGIPFAAQKALSSQVLSMFFYLFQDG